MSTTINGVTVKMGRMADDWRKHAVIVQVASRVKPGLKAAQELDPGQAVNARQLIAAVGAAAAVGAEYLGQKYNDLIDPSAATRDAIQAFGEEARLIGELAKGMPDKVRRLRREQARFSDQERELIARMAYLMDKGEKLTREEAEWVNDRIADLHGQQL